MTRPLSLLLLNPVGRRDWGGGETGMLAIARGLSRRGWTVAAAGRRDSRFLSGMADAGVTVHGLGLRRDFGPLDALRLRRILRRGNVHVVLAKLSRGIRTAGLAKCLGARSSIVQQQGLFDFREGFRHRFAYRWVERILTPAHSIRSLIVATGSFDASRVDWVPNGVDADRFSPDRERGREYRRRMGLPDGPLVVNASRLHDQKAHETLLGALALLPPAVHMAIAGIGKREPEIRQAAFAIGVAHRVRFLGHVDDVPDLLRAADVFALSSNYEGMPNNVLEAMAAATPVVATDVGDVRLMLGEEAGILVPPKSAPELARALRRLVSDPGARSRLGATARRRVLERHRLSGMIDGVERCLRRAAGEEMIDSGRSRAITAG